MKNVTDRRYVRDRALNQLSPEFCNGPDRRCFNVDGRPKRLYLTKSAAKALSTKPQSVYRCPLGMGFHVGTLGQDSR